MCPNATIPHSENVYNAIFPTTATVKITTLPLAPLAPVAVTEGAANTFGADAVISAATAADLWLYKINFSNFSAAGVWSFQVQDDAVVIWTGGPCTLLGAAGAANFQETLPFPLFIATGSNIDVNCCTVAGGALTCSCRLGFYTVNLGFT